MTPEHLAKEAERLCKDVVLLEALKRIKLDAYEELATANPEETAQIIGYQQKALMTDEILNQLQRFILAIADE